MYIKQKQKLQNPQTSETPIQSETTSLRQTDSHHEPMAIEKFGSAPDSDTKPNKVRWGDLEEEEDYGDSLYKFNDEGNEVKITTTTRVRNLSKAEQRIAERRAWPKFGDEVDEDTNARLTMVSTEEIFLERPRPPGSSSIFLFNFYVSYLIL